MIWIKNDDFGLIPEFISIINSWFGAKIAILSKNLKFLVNFEGKLMISVKNDDFGQIPEIINSWFGAKTPIFSKNLKFLTQKITQPKSILIKNQMTRPEIVYFGVQK